MQIAALVEAPDGKEIEAVRKNVRVAGTLSTEHLSITVPEPELWWPNGYGSQSLYTVKISLFNADSGELLDVSEKRIGLRTMTVNTDKDEWGECFAHEVNKVKLFAMGADYIPDDNLLQGLRPKERESFLRQQPQQTITVSVSGAADIIRMISFLIFAMSSDLWYGRILCSHARRMSSMMILMPISGQSFVII